VQSSIDRDLKAAQQDADDQLAAYARQAEADASQELRDYAAQVASDAEQKTVAAQDSLSRELAARVKDLGRAATASPAGYAVAGGPAQPAATSAPSPLQLRRNALQASLVADVQRLAALVAHQSGFGAAQVVATSADRPAGGVDLTAAVAKQLAKSSGR
jgi:hypothetical protein